ncbi:MAG: hypothetical protein ACH350_04310 [Parachlamydiaceae bacterium]
MLAFYQFVNRPFQSLAVIHHDNRFRAFIYWHRLNTSPCFVYLIAGALAATGSALMSCPKKIGLTTYGAPFVLTGGFMITLIGMASLYAGHQVGEGQGSLTVLQMDIQQLEEAGDYPQALKIARNRYEESRKIGMPQQAAHFLQVVKRLEEELLTLGSSRLLFDEHGQPRVKLLQLLECVGMEPLHPTEKAVIQINDWAQKHLLRKGERWQEQTDRFEELKPKIKPLLTELGFVDATFPRFKEYQGAIVHGALLPRVRLRLHDLVQQWKMGVRFSRLYFLSSERPLDIQQENDKSFLDDTRSLLKIKKDWLPPLEFPKTESEMTRLVWEQSDIPEEMRNNVEVCFVNASMKKDSKGEKTIRPTTDETVEAWLKTSPPIGRYLAITNAPYTNRQDFVIRSLSPPEYGFDTVGSAASEQEKMAIFLDELARFIFQTKQISEKQHRI